ncbi:pyridoxal phosphate-dependent aminotransferase [Lentilactobacillus sp. Marseille-Q4993]|uniref:pyridoxal phosphate-dependent aminotransferase n=1 Tax=Lentilactobacillus sp. Marseille-Q4993 TaxID=3039492 RepID=UPI0024BD4C6A|nr:pyridoxal phosphate-dependent aminotransferase [Lentilactobacillus sp. Marseille-Q4993]
MKFSTRANMIQPSATVAVSNKAKQMIKDGIDVINLSIGEPDFETPDFINDAAKAAIDSGKSSFYTPASGISELKEAISERIKADYGVMYSPDNISVAVGAKMALYTLFQVLTEQGDEVLIPQPSWVSYTQQVILSGATPVMVPTNNEFKITPDSLDKTVTKNTKVLILNSPQNPTGTVYSRDELTAIGNWAVMHNITMIADDIYQKLVYNDNQFVSLVQLGDQIAASTILVNGVSKAYSMTGWRIGYIAGEPELIQKVNAMASHSQGSPTAVSEYAAVAAFNSDQSAVESMRIEFEKRLNTIYPKVNALPGFKMEFKPQGAFYLFPEVSEAVKLTGSKNTSELVERILTEAHVAVVDGAAFSMDNHLRLSYATSLDDLETAIQRISDYLNQFVQ